MIESDSQLPILDCHGCGVCCLHMGYPAFNLTRDQLIAASRGQEIDSRELGPAAIKDLERWVEMPPIRQQEILSAMQDYQSPSEGELDSACIWLDPTSRLCRHHLHRPQVCRDFEIGCKQCHGWRNHYRELIQTQSASKAQDPKS